MLRAQVGDRQAIEALLRSVQPMLARYVRAVVGAADAEDVTQDVMVLIYRKLWTLTAPDLFRPWAYRIASRAAFRHLKCGAAGRIACRPSPGRSRRPIPLVPRTAISPSSSPSRREPTHSTPHRRLRRHPSGNRGRPRPRVWSGRQRRPAPITTVRRSPSRGRAQPLAGSHRPRAQPGSSSS